MDLKKLQKYRNKKGVYCLYNKDNLVYIGYSSNVYVRTLEHISESKKEFNKIKAFDGSEISTQNNLLVEMGLICEFKPLYNKIYFESFFIWFNSLPNKHEYENEAIIGTISALSENIKTLDDERMIEL